MDAAGKFNGMALVYTKGRPSYADIFLVDLYEQFGCSANSIVADIGSGTGKFSKQMLERGTCVYCIEPNEDMRNQAVIELGKYENCRMIAGDSAYTTLQDDSVDFITVAQAFHWFDTELFKKECKRIIKTGGKVFLIWNMRDMHSDFAQETYKLYKKYCPQFKGFGGGIQKNDLRIKNFFDDKYERLEYDNPLYYDRDKFISRSLSGSYSLKQQDSNYEEYVSRLNRLFDEYANDNAIIMQNKTVVYVGSVK